MLWKREFSFANFIGPDVFELWQEFLLKNQNIG
jgi:hypothetical protein